MARLLDQLPLWLALLLVLTVGLSPYAPEPHLWEKLGMLAAGELRRGVDIFDLCLHAAPWLLLAAKLGRMAQRRG